MNRSQIVRATRVLLPIGVVFAALSFVATNARSEEHDKSAALAAKLKSEQPLPRGEYQAAEASRAEALDERLDSLEKALRKLDERLEKLDGRFDEIGDRLAKIEKAVKP